MKKNKLISMLLVGALSVSMVLGFGGAAFADTADKVPAKAPVANGELLDAAKIMVAGAQNKAEEIKVPMVISVVDMDGNLVLLHRMEDSLLASLEIAHNTAYTSVALKMPSADVKKLAQEGQEL